MRYYGDWLAAFMDYAKYSEAPKHMHFWSGVSAVAGALRRKVWIDQAYFKWHANMYIVFVAPPGVVSKSTTADMSMRLLKAVPGIKFGPDVVTWPALVSAFAQATEGFEYKGDIMAMSALTFSSSEFGNLLNPQDKDMVDLLVSLWDGKQGTFEKVTKHCGGDTVENPWINLIACTTPSWIAGNFPEYMIGGGFTSRCLFVYAAEKSKFVAYPGLAVPKNLSEMEGKLISDLESISQLAGEYKLTPEAYQWGTDWYHAHHTTKSLSLDDERFGGYVARKQTHIHKLAMVLAAASSDELVISKEHLEVANQMVTDLEPDMQFVFAKIGKSETSVHAERLVWFIQSRGEISFAEAYRHVHSHFPSMRDFEDVLTGCVKAGFLTMKQTNGSIMLSVGPQLPASMRGTHLGAAK